MTFDEILAQACALLQREGRVSYRALKRRLALDDEDLEDLKSELIDAKRLAVDDGGNVLVWVGDPSAASSQFSVASSSPPPIPQTADAGLRTPDSSKLQTLDPRRDVGERRQLTVMFCDLVGSTALSERMDPEEWRTVVQEYQRVCAEVIHRFEGHIAQYLGDGLLIYFGYPAAHEDDAQRAARAGLEIVTVVGARLRPSPSTGHVPLQVRIGIHTGLVVVGDIGEGGRHGQLALGDTPNIAARLQGLAEPNTVVISAATHRLIAGYLDCQDLGLHTLKGISTPMPVYLVVGESGRSRLEVAITTGLTPLVGREEEVSLLLRRWEQASAGDGQVVLLNGEAGIGKSRLVQVLKEHIAREEHARVECRCSPYYQNSALYPMIDHLQRLLQFTREDAPEEKLRKLEVEVQRGMSSQPDILALFAALLSIPLPDHYPPLNLTPQRQKQKTLEALQEWLLKEAEQRPVLLIVEDLHWVDPSTLEFLGLLIDHTPTARLLILLTFRPDFHPPWAMLSHLTLLSLSRLGHRQVETMVERVTGGKALPTEVTQQIRIKTDGVPLFVEELTKMVLESGLLREVDGAYALTGPLPLLAIPATLQDSMMARLDRLAAVKEVAQLGATLGREFSYELMRAVAPVDERSLQQALAKLVEAELLYQRGQPPQAHYAFKHALIQDAAYQSLLKSKRQQYHQLIARVLEEKFVETKETQPELLAHHYTEAGLSEQAIPYWQKAGQRATQQSAHVEVISHLTKGLELLAALPNTPERAQQELLLQTALNPALMATKGWAAPEVGQAYARARELCQQVGETPQLFPVLYGLCGFYTTRAELLTARKLGEQLLTLAWNTQDPALLMEAHFALGQSLFWFGEFALAREHVEQGITLYNPLLHRSHAFLYGQDSGISCLLLAALTLWHLGYPAQALKRSDNALTLAQELSYSYSLAGAPVLAAMLHQFRREGQAAQERAEAAIALSSEQGFPLLLARGTILRGWALAEQGQGEEGIVQMRQGLAALWTTGAEVFRLHFLTLLAEAYGKAGQAEEGLTLLAEALAAVGKSGERFFTVHSPQSTVRNP
ncbi:MAG: AAA family ATPase [Deltaproteobacteria bacterium]|nr:AAA family ATPase [Deltaproteobacteria bacterium]